MDFRFDSGLYGEIDNWEEVELPFTVELLEELYLRDNYSFDDVQMVNLIKQLSYLDCGRLNEMLYFAYVKLKPEYIRENLNEDLSHAIETLPGISYCKNASRNSFNEDFNMNFNESFDENFNKDKGDLIEVFCVVGYLNPIKYLYQHKVLNTNGYYFGVACTNGHLEIAKFFFSKMKQKPCIILYGHVCNNDNVEIFNWLYSLNNSLEDEFFNDLYKFAKFNIIQRLHELNLIVYYDFMFVHFCECGDLNICKWLYSTGKIKRFLKNNLIFEHMIHVTTNLETIQWLNSIEPINQNNLIKIIQEASYDGQISTLEWILSLQTIPKNIFIQSLSYTNPNNWNPTQLTNWKTKLYS